MSRQINKSNNADAGAASKINDYISHVNSLLGFDNLNTDTCLLNNPDDTEIEILLQDTHYNSLATTNAEKYKPIPLNVCEKTIKERVVSIEKEINSGNVSSHRKYDFKPLEYRYQQLLSYVLHNPVFSQLVTLPQAQDSMSNFIKQLSTVRGKYIFPYSDLPGDQRILTLPEIEVRLKKQYLELLEKRDADDYKGVESLEDYSHVLLSDVMKKINEIKQKKDQIKCNHEAASPKTAKNKAGDKDQRSKKSSCDLSLTDGEKLLFKIHEHYIKIKTATDDGSIKPVLKLEGWLDQVHQYYNRLSGSLGGLNIYNANLYTSLGANFQFSKNTLLARYCATLFFQTLFSIEETAPTLKLCNEVKAKRCQKSEDEIEPSCLSFFTVKVEGKNICFVAPSSLHSDKVMRSDSEDESNRYRGLGEEATQMFALLKRTQRILNSNVEKSANTKSDAPVINRFVVLNIHNPQFDSLLEHILVARFEGMKAHDSNINELDFLYPHMSGPKSLDRDPFKCCAEKRFVSTISKLILQGKENKPLQIQLLDSVNCNLSKMVELTKGGKSKSFPDIVFTLKDGKEYYTATKPCCPNCQANQLAVYMMFVALKNMVAQVYEATNTTKVSQSDSSLFGSGSQSACPKRSLSPVFEREMSKESFDYLCGGA